MFQSGTNSNLLDASRSYPGPFLPQREQIGRPFARGSMSTSKKGLLPRDFDQSLLFVDEGLERLDTIENTLEMHPAVAPAKGLSKQPHLYRMTPQDAFFPHCPPEGRCLQAAERRRMLASTAKRLAASSRRDCYAEADLDPAITCAAAGDSPRPTHASSRHATRTRNAEAYSGSVFTHRFC